MRLFSLFFLLPGTFLLLSACNKTESDLRADSFPDELVSKGREVYLIHCAACHGPNGEGQNPAAPLRRDETGRYPAPPHNENGHTWHHDDDLLIRIITEGGMGDTKNFYEMPAFGDKLGNEDIQAIITFIKTLWSDEQRESQRKVTEAARSQQP
ncbi:MAG: cytochrome c [Anaerolineae bacterium]|jgi:mono/diheme cytochrome c family protein|nr:MAG: cytochrome c [Anaerolineae bacterium]